MSGRTDERTCAEDGCENAVVGYQILCDDHVVLQRERRAEIERDAERRMDESDVDLTPSQRRTIQRIMYSGWQEAAGNQLQFYRSHEVKRFEISRTDYGQVMVVAEFGRKEDEGTMASVFCRERGQFFIGSHGGLTFYREARDGSGKLVTHKGTRRLYLAWGR